MEDHHYNDQAFEKIRPACLYSKKPIPDEITSTRTLDDDDDSSSSSSPWKDLIARRHLKARDSAEVQDSMSDPGAAFNLFSQPQYQEGVPLDRRGECWYVWSGAEAKALESDTSYVEYCCNSTAYDTRGENEEEEARQDIEKDLYRTFPKIRYFRSSDSTVDDHDELPHIRKLRNVLQAYSVRNPNVGYCQGMNFLVALLLVYLDESEAFWTLCCLVEDIFPRYYTKCMAGSHTDQRVLVDLIQQTCPRIYQHIQHLGLVHLQFMPLTFKWFLCLFCHSVPLDVCLLTWDLIFYCRHRDVVFGFALALLQLKEPEILSLDDPVELYSILRFINMTSSLCLVQLAQQLTQQAAYRLVSIAALRTRHEVDVTRAITAANVRRTTKVEEKNETCIFASSDLLMSEYDFMDDIYAELRHSGSQRQFESTYQYHTTEVSKDKSISNIRDFDTGTLEEKIPKSRGSFDSWIKTLTGKHE